MLHDAAGPAGDWARAASVGDVLEVALTPARPKAPAGTELYLLGGDVTALPAINSWLARLPPARPFARSSRTATPIGSGCPSSRVRRRGSSGSRPPTLPAAR